MESCEHWRGAVALVIGCCEPMPILEAALAALDGQTVTAKAAEFAGVHCWTDPELSVPHGVFCAVCGTYKPPMEVVTPCPGPSTVVSLSALAKD